MRFDGNSILIADPDTAYGLQLSDALSFYGAKCVVAEHLAAAKVHLKNHDFDMIISNYYLADGIIHQLIDWCTFNLESLPIFTCIGYPFPAEVDLSRKQAISGIFSKNESHKILNSVSNLLFDFNEFKENLLETLVPAEILIELHVKGQCHLIRPIEITSESIFLQVDNTSPKDTFGILKFSLISEGQTQNFLIPGKLTGTFPGGQLFKINQKYHGNWDKFLKFMNFKQMRITHFLNKASGL